MKILVVLVGFGRFWQPRGGSAPIEATGAELAARHAGGGSGWRPFRGGGAPRAGAHIPAGVFRRHVASFRVLVGFWWFLVGSEASEGV